MPKYDVFSDLPGMNFSHINGTKSKAASGSAENAFEVASKSLRAEQEIATLSTSLQNHIFSIKFKTFMQLASRYAGFCTVPTVKSEKVFNNALKNFASISRDFYNNDAFWSYIKGKSNNLSSVEYPLVLFAEAGWGNGKRGFLLTNRHIYCNSTIVFGTENFVCDIKGTSLSIQEIQGEGQTCYDIITQNGKHLQRVSNHDYASQSMQIYQKLFKGIEEIESGEAFSVFCGAEEFRGSFMKPVLLDGSFYFMLECVGKDERIDPDGYATGFYFGDITQVGFICTGNVDVDSEKFYVFYPFAKNIAPNVPPIVAQIVSADSTKEMCLSMVTIHDTAKALSVVSALKLKRENVSNVIEKTGGSIDLDLIAKRQHEDDSQRKAQKLADVEISKEIESAINELKLEAMSVVAQRKQMDIYRLGNTEDIVYGLGLGVHKFEQPNVADVFWAYLQGNGKLCSPEFPVALCSLIGGNVLVTNKRAYYYCHMEGEHFSLAYTRENPPYFELVNVSEDHARVETIICHQDRAIGAGDVQICSALNSLLEELKRIENTETVQALRGWSASMKMAVYFEGKYQLLFSEGLSQDVTNGSFVLGRPKALSYWCPDTIVLDDTTYFFAFRTKMLEETYRIEEIEMVAELERKIDTDGSSVMFLKQSSAEMRQKALEGLLKKKTSGARFIHPDNIDYRVKLNEETYVATKNQDGKSPKVKKSIGVLADYYAGVLDPEIVRRVLLLQKLNNTSEGSFVCPHCGAEF